MLFISLWLLLYLELLVDYNCSYLQSLNIDGLRQLQLLEQVCLRAVYTGEVTSQKHTGCKECMEELEKRLRKPVCWGEVGRRAVYYDSLSQKTLRVGILNKHDITSVFRIPFLLNILLWSIHLIQNLVMDKATLKFSVHFQRITPGRVHIFFITVIAMAAWCPIQIQ